jgi:short-subunit dehydrogenase
MNVSGLTITRASRQLKNRANAIITIRLARDAGWSESMAFELGRFGIGIKSVEPGGMQTDFFTRSFDTGRHEAYDQLVDKVMGVITDPNQLATYSSPEQIANVVYEAPRMVKSNCAMSPERTPRRHTRCVSK